MNSFKKSLTFSSLQISVGSFFRGILVLFASRVVVSFLCGRGAGVGFLVADSSLGFGGVCLGFVC